MSKSKCGTGRYGVWIETEDAAPFIELQETFQTKREALSAATRKLKSIQIKIVNWCGPKPQIKSYVPLVTIKEGR